MAERPETRLVAIRAAIAQQVADHARDYPHLWREVPHVYAGLSASLTDAPLPLVVISIGEATDGERGGTFTRSDFEVEVYIASIDAGDPEGACEALAADVTRAIETDITLGGGTDGELRDGYLMRSSKGACEVHLDGVVGYAKMLLKFTGTYTWDADAP